jgi:hypothetical protein
MAGGVVARGLAIAGAICWLVVVLTHVAERWQLWPSMGWGQTDSPGHYLDLTSALAGAVFLLAAYLVYRNSNRDFQP